MDGWMAPSGVEQWQFVMRVIISGNNSGTIESVLLVSTVEAAGGWMVVLFIIRTCRIILFIAHGGVPRDTYRERGIMVHVCLTIICCARRL